MTRDFDLAPPTPPAHGTHAIVAAAAGNLLEWFDFSVYALFAIYIGKNFFPHGNPGADLVRAFLVFGLGFVIRPLGAAVIGAYGDRTGRRSALTATVLIMGCGTLIVAAAPSYAAIGLGAPLMLLAGRLLQGFSAGGEIGSAAAFLVEHAPPANKGRLCAWLQASMGLSNMLGALVGFAVTKWLPFDAVVAWGWRIPFIMGVAIVPLGLYLRRTLPETPAFAAETRRPRSERARWPVVTLFRHGSRSLIIGFGISVTWAAAVYVLLIFMPVYVQKEFGFTAAEAFGGSLLENGLFVAGCFAFGAAADRIGHSRMLGIGAALLLLVVPPLFLWLDASRSPVVLMAVLSAFGILVAAVTGVAPVVLSDLFPTGLRATGVSLAYNAAFIVFGGFAPAILTWLAAASGSSLVPAWYVGCASLPAIAAIACLNRSGGRLSADPVAAALRIPVREGP